MSINILKFLVMSCGALLTAPGVVKYPHGNNYLDGVTVTFTCKPEFFIHGDNQRTCINGTWSPGWHVWCRSNLYLFFFLLNKKKS